MLKKIENITKFREDVILAFEAIARENSALYKFLYEASNHCSVFLIGGFLRSVANCESPRDLDVIFNQSDEALGEYIEKSNLIFIKNRFGGYKINFSGISVDVWASETNWAFVDNVVSIGQKDIISGVAHGTFLNYDSLVFDLRTQKINVTGYNECVENGVLDLLLKSDQYAFKNPGKMSNVIRAFRIRQKTNLEFSGSLSKYIVKQLIIAGVGDIDNAASYLFHVITTKDSEKNSSLKDISVIRNHIYYALQVINQHKERETRQLRLFAH